ncbi:peptide chain release factor N(5)-glutamine methyltransferase [Velocimicrobium porci]|uniref:Release factor glutamine methyltransferase n=1 Tax=Velocimicrobium porci TaxID=2606634 RepID=A0A6L5XY70_9FIRM|nr:peptide chain release factor N(5)-glutamine methyltransferase [Velocimicrobium porci]MSS63816.1 peptide chain release factor N(5)-glutamine methyltransferase [Velocimicrobium porci]
MKTIEELLRNGESRLKDAYIEDAKLDAWYLMEYCFHMSRVSFLLDRNKPVSEEKEREYITLIEKRKSHIPLQHITGEQEFMGYSFYVNEHVLIPRQDTEILVEEIVPYASGKKILDMCTGSGCILISLSKEVDLHVGVGADISSEALKVAKKNAVRNQSEVRFVQSDLFTQINETFDIIVSNPPYIESREVDCLMPEVRLHEPRIALDGMEDGLYFYKKIIEQSVFHLNQGGRIFFEIGYNQGEAVSRLLEEAGYSEIKVKKDLAQLDRVVSAKL